MIEVFLKAVPAVGFLLVMLAPGRWAYRGGLACLLPALALISTVNVFWHPNVMHLSPSTIAWASALGLVLAMLIRRRFAGKPRSSAQKAASSIWGGDLTPQAPAPQETELGTARRIADRFLAILYGLTFAGIVFVNAAWYLRGQDNGYMWHAGVSLVAVLAFLIAFWLRRVAFRSAAASFGAILLALTAYSALLFPLHVAGEARAIAQDRPYCLARHTHDLPIRSFADLSLLTMDKSNHPDRSLSWYVPTRAHTVLLVDDEGAREDDKPYVPREWSFRANSFSEPYSDDFMLPTNCIPRAGFLDILGDVTDLEISADDGHSRIALAYSPKRYAGQLRLLVDPQTAAPLDPASLPQGHGEVTILWVGRLHEISNLVPDEIDMTSKPLQHGLHVHRGPGNIYFAGFYPNTDFMTTAIRCERTADQPASCLHIFLDGDADGINGPHGRALIVARYGPDLVPDHAGIEARLSALRASFFVTD